MSNRTITLPERYNYIGAFLTFACNLKCSYCVNRFGELTRQKMMSAGDWIRGLNRLVSRPDLPVTLQGGEPSMHPGFFEIIRGIKTDLRMDILTNLQFDEEEFMRSVQPERIRRNAPYASIRVSYHPETMRFEDVKRKVLSLLKRGYSVGIWGVMHPRQAAEIGRAKSECAGCGIDFRTKEYLGESEGKLHGTYKYPDALSGIRGAPVECRTTELLIGPSGNVYRCHSDLYADRDPIGHICSDDFTIDDVFRHCDNFGLCNPCDVKIKTNRFQIFGHTSVEIRPEQ